MGIQLQQLLPEFFNAILLVQSEKQVGTPPSSISRSSSVWKIDHVPAVGQFSGNFFGRVDASDFDDGISSLLHRLCDNECGLGFTFSTSYDCLSFLLCLLDDPLLTFSLLRCNLLGF